MINYYKNEQGSLVEGKEYFINSWIKVVEPNELEINELVERFKLAKDNVIDGLDIHETPRIEEDGGNVYVYLRVPTSKIEGETTSSFLIILTKRNIITISKFELEIFDKIINSKRAINTGNRIHSIMKFLSFVNLFYAVSVRKIVKEVKKDRKKLLGLSDRDIRDLVLKEDILNDYLSSFSPLIGMHRGLLKIKTFKLLKNDREFIEDLVIDLEQTLLSCKNALKSISNMRDYYTTALSVNLNKVITLLTIFTILLTIPTVISGIYGMNVVLPLQGNANVFWILLSIIVGIWVVLFFIFKKMRII